MDKKLVDVQQAPKSGTFRGFLFHWTEFIFIFPEKKKYNLNCASTEL